MSEPESSAPQGATPPDSSRARRWSRRVVNILIGLAASLIVSAIVERVTDAEWLEGAKQAQAAWIEGVSHTQPLAVAGTFWTELTGAFTGDASNGAWSAYTGSGHGLTAPFVAFGATVARLWYTSGVTGLVQIGLAFLALAVFNFRRSDGETIFFGDYALTLIGTPLAIIALASVAGLLLWGLMMGALYLLGWATGLAAWAAGATGVVGFCYYCITELTKKGAEHVITPKI